jgi:hypothetical protein
VAKYFTMSLNNIHVVDEYTMNIPSCSFEQARLLMLAHLPTHLLVAMGKEFNIWISFHYQPP